MEQAITDCFPRLYRTALRLAGNVEDASDLAQQACLNAISNWGQFGGRSLVTTWLHSILVNCYRDWRRRAAAHGNESFDEWVIAADAGSGTLEELGRREELQTIRREIENLETPLRQTFVAVVVDGYSYKQAAELLSVPVGTVGSRVNEARLRLRRFMRGCEES
jgi:RNA polymerase sigma-70 factor (ECF subfamily)